LRDKTPVFGIIGPWNMILSFHPLITGDENINCAGRPPGPEEKEAISRSKAVFVPEGVREDLYRLCRSVCPLVWPNFDLRFNYPGKVGQALLFATLGLPRPRSIVFPSVADFLKNRGGALPLPFVLKMNLGGQGSGIFPATDRKEQTQALAALAEAERQGRFGFVQQELIDHGGRDLRAAVIGRKIIAYWRQAPDGQGFLTNVAQGGRIDFDSDPHRLNLGVQAVKDLTGRTGINLAAFDLVFDRRSESPRPLFLEINYFFGRTALGGSMAYYRLVRQAARQWLKEHGLRRGRVRSRPRYTRRD